MTITKRINVILLLAALDLSSCTRPDPVDPAPPKNPDSYERVKLEVVEFVAWSGEGEKGEYARLEKWRDQSDRYPQQTLDVICKIKNNSRSAVQDGDFILLSTMDFIYMQPGETKRILVRDFDLSRLINQFNEAEDILWVWAVRVNISILDREMRVVANGQSVLPMLPGKVNRG